MLLGVLMWACGTPTTPAPTTPAVVRTVATAPAPAAERIAAGREVLERHECTRCHKVDDVAKASRPRDCVSCHRFLKALPETDRRYQSIVAKIGKPVMDRYQRKIVHLMDVPDLTGVGRRIRPSWIRDYLAAPYDLRPGLSESMIRTNLSSEERQVLADYFAAVAGDPTASPPPPKDAAVVAEGGQLFKQRGCIACHTFGNVPTGVPAAALTSNPQAKLAPNLRFTKERMDFAVTVDWIVDPKAVWPAATMPSFGVSREDATKIATWLWHADPQLRPTPPPPADLPPAVDHEVSWAEVKEEVLGHVCVHCHMNDHEKDPGPGNLGGLGYAGMKLKMRTYESLVSGYHDDHRNALQPPAEHTVPPLLDMMNVRRTEALRDQVAAFEDHVRPPFPDRLGMPLGLPAMTDRQFGILRAWIEQGCPGPKYISGQLGSTDGFLVPDGPIADNHGCHVRPPTEQRPPWAAR